MQRFRFLAVGIAGLALITGVAIDPRPAGAHAGNSSPTAVHACLHKVTGAVRIVPVDGSCHPPEVPAHWGATGPAGPPGTLNLGTIQGQVASECAPLEGTLVYLRGRSFMAKTGADGRFVLDHVPPGSYDLVVEVAGQAPHVLSGVDAAAGTPTDVGTLTVPDLQTDPQSCGTCGHVCQTGFCTAGVCVTAGGGTCGNGELDSGEQCDGAILGGASCPGGQAGHPACTATCTLDFSGCFDCPPATECRVSAVIDGQCVTEAAPDGTVCTGGVCDGGVCVAQAVCGNNVIEPGEVCDGTNLGGESCQTFGFPGGLLRCAPTCGNFIFSGCVGIPL